jgi:5-methylcytosine-specific restriction endonuclease McrA
MTKEITEQYKELARTITKLSQEKTTCGSLMEKQLRKGAVKLATTLEMQAWSRKYRQEIYERDGGICIWCHRKVNKKKFTLDHLHPISRGGKRTCLGNVAVCCKACNSDKGQLTETEYMIKLGYFGRV